MALMSERDKIFVAGHKGLAGSAIIRQLKDQGFNNLVLRTKNELNLLDTKEVYNFFSDEKPTLVFLAAAKVGGIHANSTYCADFIYENLQIQNNVIWAAHKNNVHRLIFLGSSCIYPRDCQQPIKEEYLLTGKLEPTNQAYAMAKIAGIELINSLRKQYKRDYFCAMPTNLFGPYDNFHIENSHVFAAFIRKFQEASLQKLSNITLFGDGTPLREFLFSDELGRALCFLAKNVSFDDLNNSHIGKSGFCHINVGSGNEITIKYLAELIANTIGYKGKIIFDPSMPNGTHRKLMDCDELNKFGWKSSSNFEEDVKFTVNWFQENFGKALKMESINNSV